MKPSESLAKTLDSNRGAKKKARKRPNYRNEGEREQSESPPKDPDVQAEGIQEGRSTFYNDAPSTSEDTSTASAEGTKFGSRPHFRMESSSALTGN